MGLEDQNLQEEEEEFEDPIETIYTYLQKGEYKDKALMMVEGIEENLDKKEMANLNQEVVLAINHIFASIYLWNDKFQEAKRLHDTFIEDTDWCLQNLPTIESYLIMALAKNNKRFIEQLWQNPIIESNFKKLYEAYLGSVVHPNSKSHFDLKLISYYQKLLTAKKLYDDK